MLLVTIIPDCPARISGEDSAESVLSLPLGTGTVLDHLCAEAARVGSTDVWIIQDSRSTLSPDTVDSGSRGGAMTIRCMTREQLSQLVDALEPSDQLLFLDPRHWPATGFNLAALKREALNNPGAVHAAAIGSDRTGASEHVICDEVGRVSRIRRLYSGVTQTLRHRGVVMHSILPVAAFQEIQFERLSDLPATLAAAGIVTRDLPVATDLIDLAIPHQYLALCEQMTINAVRAGTPHGFSRLAKDVIIGRGVLIHETARIVGPAIIQSDVMIEEGVSLIGPALVGAGATLHRGATIAQSVITRSATIQSGDTVCHSVVTSEALSASSESLDDVEWSNDDLESLLDVDVGEQVSPALDDLPADSRPALACKRAADILISLIALLLSLPITLISAALIKLTSRGPLFFIHEREGLNGKPFPCLKFRTMTADAHEMQRRLQDQNMLDGPHFKITNDPRVTRIGRVLRKYNIDELPQLLNVLWGHMSLVGPRPSPFRENQYCIPWRRARLSVRPGVTGIWQICRSGRHEGDFQQWIYYDMIYVRRMTPLLDLRILMATVYSLATGGEIPLSWVTAEEPVLISDCRFQAPLHADQLISAGDRMDRGGSRPYQTADSMN